MAYILGRFKEKASILHKIARKKGQDEANGVGMFNILCNSIPYPFYFSNVAYF